MKRSIHDVDVDENDDGIGEYEDTIEDMKCMLRYQALCIKYKNFIKDDTHHVTRNFLSHLFTMFEQNYTRMQKCSDNNTYTNSLVVHVLLSKLLDIAFKTTVWKPREEHNMQRALYRKIKK